MPHRAVDLPGEVWTLPGGGLDFGESPERRRSCASSTEEIGYDGEIDRAGRCRRPALHRQPTARAGCTRSGSSTGSGSPAASCATRSTARPTRARWFTPDEAAALAPRRAGPAGRVPIGRRRTSRRCTAPSAIDVAAPADARLRARPRRRTAGSGCSPTTRGRARSSARADGSLVVEFVARRPFPLVGVLGLGLPVAWRARTWNEPATLPAAVRPRRRGDQGDGRDLADRADARAAAHVAIDHDFRPPVRAVRRLRRPCLHPADRGPDARHVQGARRGAAPTRRRTRPP